MGVLPPPLLLLLLAGSMAGSMAGCPACSTRASCVAERKAGGGNAGCPMATTQTEPCDSWMDLSNHNAVYGMVDAVCNTAAADKPPCKCGRPEIGDGYYLLGHVDSLSACQALAESLLLPAVTGAGVEVCKVVTWSDEHADRGYASSCVCGTTLQYIAPENPQAGFDSAACQSYSALGAIVAQNEGLFFLLFVGLGGMAYLLVGMAMHYRRAGAKGMAALPHRAFWLGVHGLVVDGVQFTAGWAGVTLPIDGAYSSLPSAAAPVRVSEEETKSRSLKSKKKDKAVKPRRKEKKGKGEHRSRAAPAAPAAVETSSSEGGAAEARARQLAEQRDETVHSSMAKVQVVTLQL
eukprot:COSAG06_NODE_1281_length_10018_cov_15.949894_7_plen_349_part_00